MGRFLRKLKKKIKAKIDNQAEARALFEERKRTFQYDTLASVDCLSSQPEIMRISFFIESATKTKKWIE